MTYLFEVKGFIYTEPPEEFGLTKMTQACYIAEPGSIACYRGTDEWDMSVCEKGFWFPKDDCRNPSIRELKFYSVMDLI